MDEETVALLRLSCTNDVFYCETTVLIYFVCIRLISEFYSQTVQAAVSAEQDVDTDETRSSERSTRVEALQFPHTQV